MPLLFVEEPDRAKLETSLSQAGLRVREVRSRDEALALLSEEPRPHEALQSAQFYQQLFDDFPALIWQSGPDGKCSYFNRTWLNFTGRSMKQELGDGWTEAVHPDDLSQVINVYLEAFQNQAPFVLEYRLRRHDGEYRDVVDHGRPYRAVDGSFAGYVGSCYDDTEHREAERALHASEERFRRYFELGLIGMAITSPTGRFVEVNDKICEILGYDREELLRTRWTEFTYPEDLALDLKHFGQVVTGELAGYSLDKRFVRKDGRVIHSTISVRGMQEPDGSVKQFLALLQDVTRRKEAEERLRKLQTQLADAQRLAHLGSWEWDLDSNAVTWSDETYRIMGFEPHEAPATYATMMERLHPEDRERTRQVVQAALQTGQAFSTEYRVVLRDGAIRLQRAEGKVDHDRHGRATRVIGTAQDITERRAVEEALRASAELRQMLTNRLFAVHEAERHHLARELHDEIGQTLTAAKLEIQTAKALRDPADVALRLDDTAALLDRLLQSIRTLSLELRPALLDEVGLVAALETHARTQAQRAGIEVRFAADAESDHYPWAIEIACFRVGQEAVTNIVRHAHARNIEIELRRTECELKLRIRDDGAGFDPLAAESRARSGSSLGLLSMRERVELIGGNFVCESHAGQGTEIRAEFPLTGVGGDPGDRDEKTAAHSG